MIYRAKRLNDENFKKDNKLKNLSEKLNEITIENSLYNEELENIQKELENIQKELHIYKEQCKSNNKKIITLTKSNDKLKFELGNFKKDKLKDL